MKKITVCTIALTSFLTAGCAYWPPYGEGGQAEDFVIEDYSDQGLYEQNRLRLACFHRDLQNLKASKVGKTHPAALIVLDQQWSRARRAHSARMDFEAREGLDALAASAAGLRDLLEGRTGYTLVNTASAQQETCS